MSELPTPGPVVDGPEERRQAVREELAAEVGRRLAPLRAPGARARVEAAMAAKGRIAARSAAGASF